MTTDKTIRRVSSLEDGGHAFGVYAEPRATKDLDIVIASNPENAKAALESATTKNK